MKREDEFVGLGSMKIWLIVLAGLLVVSTAVYYGIGFFRNNQSLAARTYRDGAFSVRKDAPWGIGSEDLRSRLRWAAAVELTQGQINRMQELSQKQKDGSYNLCPYETQSFRDCRIQLSVRYHISGDGVLTSGVFSSDDLMLPEIIPETKKLVRSISALPVEADKTEAEILAELDAPGFSEGAWTWHAGDTELQIAVMSRGYRYVLEVRVFGPDEDPEGAAS